ncbi:MAG: TolC family protein [Desulforegulaceae bacterium]|nr:TolC family protein [Desulforegulaceae bacterium]
MDRNYLIFIVIIVFLQGCATGHKYIKPENELQKTFIGSSETKGILPQTKPLKNWWQSFNDPVLDRLVNEGQNRNISLKIAGERIKAARSYQAAVASSKVPSVSLGFGFSAFQLSENDPLLGPAFAMTNPVNGGNLLERRGSGFLAGALISWEPDIFGRIGQRVKAAEIRAEETAIFREAVVVMMTSDIIYNYLELRGSQCRLDIADSNIEKQRKILEIVKTNYENGLASELDVAKAEALLAATESIKPKLELAEKAHIFRIAILLNKDNKELIDILSVHKKLPVMKENIPVGLPSDLLKRRPDIKIAEREMAASDADLAAAVANRYPRFVISGGPGLHAENMGDFFSGGSDIYGFGAGIKWDLFDGGLRKSMKKAASANFEASALLYELSVKKAVSEVEITLVNYTKTQDFALSVKTADKKSEKVLEKVAALYSAGLIGHLDLLAAQREKNNISDLEVVSRLQTVNAVLSLYKALGGNWEDKAQ